jgi:hypothetical protein
MLEWIMEYYDLSDMVHELIIFMLVLFIMGLSLTRFSICFHERGIR